MRSLKKTGTDWSSAQGMDPKAFFEVMGTLFHLFPSPLSLIRSIVFIGLNEVVSLDARAGGRAFEVV